ncbi:MAG: histidine--tRNA ligase [Endomicrobium sp.]|jgi:histidyl-tRNA synthetase|nr:histidine--tRNA ligase [Endomicrobium sp.]
MIYKAPRGTHDIFGEDVLAINLLEKYARNIFTKNGFEEIRTPMFEEANLFIRAIGSITDIVEKEMYVFNDKKGRKLALRPEGTASIARAFIEHKMNVLNTIGKFFYIGEMFRYEKPQNGRYRQFHQIGAEYFGNDNPIADAEIITLAQNILAYIGIKNINININSLGCQHCRPKFKKILVKYFYSMKKDLCDNCLSRLDTNPFRLLDCKLDTIKFINTPKITNYLCNNCINHFNTLKLLLKSGNCKYHINNKLVRGLDYYTKTIFEINTINDEDNAQSVLAAGGRYNNLVNELSEGKINTPAVGFAFGVERVLRTVQKTLLINKSTPNEKILIALADKELLKEAFYYYTLLRKTLLQHKHNITLLAPIDSISLTKQLKFANQIGISKTIIFAKEEYCNHKVIIKYMNNRKQITISISNLSKFLLI